VKLGLVRRNTGYGHPMRPEYLLTASGKAIGPCCVSLAAYLDKMGWQKPGLDKWSLPVTALIGEDTLRFGELRDGLSGASPRAIALALKSLENLGWVKRSIVCEYPLAAGYRLEKAARNMLPDLRKMCAVIKTGDPRIVGAKKRL